MAYVTFGTRENLVLFLVLGAYVFGLPHNRNNGLSGQEFKELHMLPNQDIFVF